MPAHYESAIANRARIISIAADALSASGTMKQIVRPFGLHRARCTTPGASGAAPHESDRATTRVRLQRGIRGKQKMSEGSRAVYCSRGFSLPARSNRAIKHAWSWSICHAWLEHRVAEY